MSSYTCRHAMDERQCILGGLASAARGAHCDGLSESEKEVVGGGLEPIPDLCCVPLVASCRCYPIIRRDGQRRRNGRRPPEGSPSSRERPPAITRWKALKSGHQCATLP